MGEPQAELTIRTAPAISESERGDQYLRLYDAFLETTTQMLATPKLNERLQLALEGVETIFGHRQAAIAIINEREADLRIRVAIGFDHDFSGIEMPIDSRCDAHVDLDAGGRSVTHLVRENALGAGRARVTAVRHLGDRAEVGP